MRITKDIEAEIFDQLTSACPDFKDYQISTFTRVLGGADTTIFSFDLISTSKTIPLILRIFRPNFTESAKREFQTLIRLHSRGLKVPKPYFWVPKSTQLGCAYIVMERIDGKLLADVLHAVRSDERFLHLIHKFIINLVAIHSIKWSNAFSSLASLSIREDPHIFCITELARQKRIVEENKIEEFFPLIKWMERNQVPSKEHCLLHGDYHAANVLVTKNHDLFTIDWGSIKMGDFRYDLGYSIMALNSAGYDTTDLLINHYEAITGTKVDNIEYFMVLSVLGNLLKIYSAVFNHKITGETEDSARFFIHDIKDYSCYLVNFVRKITGITLTRLTEALNCRISGN